VTASRGCRPALVLAGTALAFGACGSTEREASSAAAGVPVECARAVPVRPLDLPAGFPRPKGTILAEPAQGDNRLRQVRGFVTRLPGDAIADIGRTPGAKVIDSEDEGFDAEVTISAAGRRTFFKFVKVCEAGSRFTAQQVPEP